MWLGKKFSAEESIKPAESASITACNGTLLSASGSCSEYRDMPVFSCYGITSKPVETTQALVIPFEDSGACVGFLSSSDESLNSGEIQIKAPSGAYIKLCSNGTIIINGVVFNQNGTMQYES